MHIDKLFQFDGKIPFWGLLLVGAGQVVYGYQALSDLDKRLAIREQSAIVSTATIARLETEQREFLAMKGDISTLKELLVRIERKLDNPAR